MPAPGSTPDGEHDPTEVERIRGLYEGHYRQDKYKRLWAGPVIREIHRGKWETLRSLLRDTIPLPKEATIVDLGAGIGPDCAEFDRLGCDRTKLLALDLVASDLQVAKRRMPWLLAGVGDAARLPIADGRVDLVFQSTMLSSILDASLRQRICAEAARVLRRGGTFVSYDTRYPNPWNPHTRPVGLAELRGFFPGWRVGAKSVTLLPPLLRALLPVSPRIGRALERIPILRSHLVAWAVKP